jgi:hypothetical protein
MSKNRCANVCLVLIVFLLGVIALRMETTPTYAAKKFKYKVVPVFEGTADQNMATQVQKETDAGWEVVAAPMWAWDGTNPARGFVIFRK